MIRITIRTIIPNHKPRGKGRDQADVRHHDPGGRTLVPGIHNRLGMSPAEAAARQARAGPAASSSRTLNPPEGGRRIINSLAFTERCRLDLPS